LTGDPAGVHGVMESGALPVTAGIRTGYQGDWSLASGIEDPVLPISAQDSLLRAQGLRLVGRCSGIGFGVSWLGLVEPKCGTTRNHSPKPVSLLR
jgi:hypothetical protein